MTALLNRLRKLELEAADRGSGVASWPVKEAAVKESAMARMSRADQAFLRDLFATGNMTRQQELIDKDPAVWARWNEAFDVAMREVPAPYAMCVNDFLGEW